MVSTSSDAIDPARPAIATASAGGSPPAASEPSDLEGDASRRGSRDRGLDDPPQLPPVRGSTPLLLVSVFAMKNGGTDT